MRPKDHLATLKLRFADVVHYGTQLTRTDCCISSRFFDYRASFFFLMK